MSAIVRVTKAVVEKLLAEARSQPAMECCGLLSGRDRTISEVLPARNALQSATAYEIAPLELFSLFRRMRAEHLDHLGIYHSHPRGENAPSRRDIEAAYYPDAVYFIISPRADAPNPIRAFQIRDAQPTELAIEIV